MSICRLQQTEEILSVFGPIMKSINTVDKSCFVYPLWWEKGNYNRCMIDFSPWRKIASYGLFHYPWNSIQGSTYNISRTSLCVNGSYLKQISPGQPPVWIDIKSWLFFASWNIQPRSIRNIRLTTTAGVFFMKQICVLETTQDWTIEIKRVYIVQRNTPSTLVEKGDDLDLFISWEPHNDFLLRKRECHYCTQ